LQRRTLTPELLDILPADDPAARRARRDLRIFNAVMGNERWLISMVQTLVKPGERILEIGAGSGSLSRRLGRKGFCVDALDRTVPPRDWPENRRWHQCDLRDFSGWGHHPVVIANLFLHHFTADELGGLGARVAAHSRLVLACEPARRRRFQCLFLLLCVFCGAGGVSRHDGLASIAAGFSGDELARDLRLLRSNWVAVSRVCGRGAYRFIAQKNT
jgi:hypothetical protein